MHAPSNPKEEQKMEEREARKRRRRGGQTAPAGYLWVCVGAHKQRFVIKTKYTKHPLFKKLVEEAEKEYGHRNQVGPLALPCSVHIFYNTMIKMEFDDDDHQANHFSTRCPSSHHFMISPFNIYAINQF